MRNTIFLCPFAALTALSLAACGGDGDTSGSGSGASSTSASATSGGGGTGSGSTGSTGTTGSGGASPGSDQIVINEINALGTSEWVELANKSAMAVDLGGHGVADSVKDVGGPNIAEALRFPEDTTIEPGGYIIILGDQAPESPPIKHTDCLPNAPAGAVCYYAAWKISGSSGEFIHFLAPNNGLITSSEYPANAVDPLAGGATWSRLPDMTGDFSASKTATPGAANQP
jgi:hypothetical protein